MKGLKMSEALPSSQFSEVKSQSCCEKEKKKKDENLNSDSTI
jgi:hypothetical protein